MLKDWGTNTTKTVAQAANKDLAHLAAKKCPVGTLVASGAMRMVKRNGRNEIYVEGRYAMALACSGCCPPASWGSTYNLQNNLIQDGAFTMVRVSRGEIGLATENGKPVFLDEGLHVYNNPLFSFVKRMSVNSEWIRHMSYNVIRIPKGSFGKINENGRPKLLPEGKHVIDENVFTFEGTESAQEQYINHGTIHIIQVPKGSLGLIKNSNKPQMIGEGLHIYDSATLTYSGVKPKMTQCITHGTITRFRVSRGDVGLAVWKNQPEVIDRPGTYEINSATFSFVKSMPASERVITLNSKKVITVRSGEVGITYNAGSLEILQAGRHVIDDAAHMFDTFMSTQQRTMRITQQQQGKNQEELLICESKDLVKVGIRADVFFRVSDPAKVIMQVGRDIDNLVMETSIATLTNIMRSTPLCDIAQSQNPSAASAQAQEGGGPSAPLFFDKAHDLFISKLHDDFNARFGIEMTDIRIEQFKIMDQKLADSIAQQAVSTARTENRLANLEGETKIATQEQERQATVQKIQAQSEAQSRQIEMDAKLAQAQAEIRAMKVKADAHAARLKTQADGEAEAVKIKAEASVAQAEALARGVRIAAEASIAESQAQADSIRLKAQADADRAKKLGATPLGEKLALLGVYADVVKVSNTGVAKTIYVDPTTKSGGNPYGLLTLESLTSDLKAIGATSK